MAQSQADGLWEHLEQNMMVRKARHLQDCRWLHFQHCYYNTIEGRTWANREEPRRTKDHLLHCVAAFSWSVFWLSTSFEFEQLCSWERCKILVNVLYTV